MTIRVAALALTLVGHSLFAAAVRFDDDPVQRNRSSKELTDKSRTIEDPALELKTAAGRKLTPDEYNTYSSLTSDLIVEASSSSSVNSKMYPSLTTHAPTTFVTRGRYIRNPFYFTKDDQEVEFDEDQHAADLLLNSGIPRWNRYNTNHRQLNKYGPTPIEADITVDEDGSTGYGSAFEYGGGGSSYDSGGYRNPSGGGGGGGGGWSSGGEGMTGWFSEPVPQSLRPVPIIAEIRHPSSGGGGGGGGGHHKMSVDLSKIGMLALIKVAVAKLKALGFIKAMLLVLFKLKLLLLVLAVKSLMMMKMMKMAMVLPALFSLLAFPMVFSRLSRLNSLLNQPVLVPTGFPDGGNRPGNNGGDDGTGGTGGTGEEAKRRSRLNDDDGGGDGDVDHQLAYFRRLARTEKCVDRVSCRMAGARRPSPALVWINWAVKPVSKYIPSKKIRSFVTTFTEVTNYRLDNLYSSLLPTDWTKWCNDHYSCDRDKNKTV